MLHKNSSPNWRAVYDQKYWRHGVQGLHFMFPSPFHGNPAKHEKDLFNKQGHELHYRLLMRMAKKAQEMAANWGLKGKPGLGR